MAERRRRHGLLRRSFVLSDHDIGGRVVSGAGFQFLGIGLRTLITIGSTAILARLLTPADFGYVAMATVITELAGLFANFGFTNLLIQKRVINRLQLDTVFWASNLVGLVLALVVFVMSFFAGWLFADPHVGELLRVLCLTFAFSGLTSVSWVVLARLMRFRVEFWMQLATVVIRTAVAIGFAYAGFGAWALVIGGVTSGLVQGVFAFIAVPYRPRLRFHAPLLASTWRTSGSYFGGGLLYYANMNVDLILIGRQLGPTPLGFYQNARSLTDEIRARIAMPLQHVLFPAFSALQHDRERMQQMVLRSARMLAAIVVPIGFGVSAMAQDLVPLLYGPKWLAMVPVMSMFGISAALRASTAMASPLFNSSNQVALAFRYNLIGTALTILSVAAAMPFGIGVVSAAVAASSLYSVFVYRVALGYVGLDVHDLLQVLGLPIGASAAMWLAIFATRGLVFAGASSHALPLVLLTALGGGTYVSVLHVTSPKYLEDFRAILQRFRRR